MKAIHTLYPEAVKTKVKSNTEMYAWDKDGKEIELDLDAINNWVDPEAYKYQRQQEYKPLAEQLDMQYHDVQDGTETWLDHIKEVKAKYPKGDK